MKLIGDRETGLDAISHDEEERIAGLLIGHSIKKVAQDHLLLDDGTLLRIVPNQGGCSCGSGDYELADLRGVDNIITSVEFVKEGDEDDGEFSGAYRIFVFADNRRLNLFSVEGFDGNGYYGTGYYIMVRRPG